MIIVGIIGSLILLTINKQTLGDQYNAIRNEEEMRHKEVLANYLKAAQSGALTTLFPGVTNHEQIEAEKWIAESNQLSDPPLPDNDVQLEETICKVHREKGQKILGYIRKRFPTHLISQIAVRIAIDSYGKQNDIYCRDRESRTQFLRNASVVNQHMTDINIARNKVIDNNLAIVYGNSTINNMAIICCSYWAYKASYITAMPTPETKQFVSDGLERYNGCAARYLCLHYSEGTKACVNLTVQQSPQNLARFSSVTLSFIEAIAKIIAI